MSKKRLTPPYTARPVKRYLQRFLETEIGKLIISGEQKDGDNVRIDAKDGELKITVR